MSFISNIYNFIISTVSKINIDKQVVHGRTMRPVSCSTDFHSYRACTAKAVLRAV